MFWFFEVCGILVPRPGIEPATPGLEDEVSTTGPPGKAFEVDFILKKLKKKRSLSEWNHSKEGLITRKGSSLTRFYVCGRGLMTKAP